MAYISQYQYYENSGASPEDANWGSYQYVSLKDIVNNFMLMYQGNHSLVNNEDRFKILFHAKRAVQELNYDAFKEIKTLQLTVNDAVRFVLPSDYVNWVRVSLYENGVLYPMTENIQLTSAQAYLQDNNAKILFDIKGNVLKPENSLVDLSRQQGGMTEMYLGGGPYHGQMGYCCNGEWFFEHAIGARYGLNTETANANPLFTINKQEGAIYFSSDMSGKSVVLEYVSDGMNNGNDSEINVNKLFEEFIYAYIRYSLLNSKFGVQEYIVTRARKEKSALLRNAKLRLSNMHPGRLLMNMRGQDKWIK